MEEECEFLPEQSGVVGQKRQTCDTTGISTGRRYAEPRPERLGKFLLRRDIPGDTGPSQGGEHGTRHKKNEGKTTKAP